MLAEERKEKIIQMLEKNGNIKVSNLTRLFDVSLQTIRRDLEVLESEGLIKKVYGGAILKKKRIQDFTHSSREKQSLAEKDEIAEISQKAVIIADSSKLESTSLIKVRDAADVDLLVTDSNISSEIKSRYEKAGIRIINR